MFSDDYTDSETEDLLVYGNHDFNESSHVDELLSDLRVKQRSKGGTRVKKF